MNFKRRISGREKGFTLIELLVVIAIIGVLASVVMASLVDARKRADDTRRSQDLANVKIALELYYSANNHYPSLSWSSDSNSQYVSQNIEDQNVRTGFASFLAIVPLVKIAEAQSLSAECANFNNMAGRLVEANVLSEVPQAPSSGNCYRAWESSDLLSVYTYVSTRYLYTSEANTDVNKKIGFVIVKPAGNFSGSSEDNLTVLKASCLGTGSDYGDTFPTFDPKESGTAICNGNTIADKVIGVTAGTEVSSDGDVVEEEGSCSNPTYTNEADCIATDYTCSDGSGTLTSENSCESALCGATDGTCSEGGYQSESACTQAVCGGSPGSCSNANYNDQASCTQAMCSIGAGNCSGGGYTNASSCTNAQCDSGQIGSCSGGAYGDPWNCTNAMCGSYSPAYCANASGADESECSMNGGQWIAETSPTNCGYEWITPSQVSCGYIWTENESSCGYTWGNESPGSYCGYSWTPGSSGSLCGYEWSGTQRGVWTE